MDRPKGQTATATPAKPGGLPLTLVPHVPIMCHGALGNSWYEETEMGLTGWNDWESIEGGRKYGQLANS